MDSLNAVDIAIIAIVLFSVVMGLVRGAVREVISVLSWVAAYIVASYYAGTLASVFTSSSIGHSAMSSAGSAVGTGAATTISMLAVGISFVCIFVLVLLIGSLVNYLFSSLADVSGLGLINRILGSLFGLVRGCLVIILLVFIVNLTPLATQSLWMQSKSVQAAQPGVQWLSNIIQPSLQDMKSKLSQSMQGVSPGQIIDKVKSTYQNSGASQLLQGK